MTAKYLKCKHKVLKNADEPLKEFARRVVATPIPGPILLAAWDWLERKGVPRNG